MNDQAKAGLSLVMAVAEAIQDLGEVPSGHLYAALMSRMSLDQYTRVIDILKRAELVKEDNHLLTWAGPASKR